MIALHSISARESPAALISATVLLFLHEFPPLWYPSSPLPAYSVLSSQLHKATQAVPVDSFQQLLQNGANLWKLMGRQARMLGYELAGVFCPEFKVLQQDGSFSVAS